ncbi:MAG: hypothetical protein ABIH23_33010 [bacterium]
MRRGVRTAFVCVVCVLPFHAAIAQSDEQKDKIVLRFSASEAHQGLAVDKKYVYAIATRAIGKYEKRTGKRVALWESSEEEPIIHLDSGVVVDGKLHCGHSNFPYLPMTSSVEIWDTDTLKHIESHSFGITDGSCTWIDRHDGHWWVGFAHYNGKGGYADKGNEWTTLVQYDDCWRRLQAWVFPAEVLERFAPHSCSGGSWGPDGLLYCSGHDRPELYLLQLPKAGSVLRLVRMIPFDNEGQGIAFDRTAPGILYGIKRSTKEVVAARSLSSK